MKPFFLFSALTLSTVIAAQESPGEAQVVLPQQATYTDSVSAEIELEEAAPTSASLVMQSVKISSVLYDLNEGLITKEKAQAKIDSIISELYLTSASFFENYVPDTVEEPLSWNDDFSAAYSGPDSSQYPQEHYDTTFEDFDFDFSSFFDDPPKTKVGVFDFHLGPNALILSDRSIASAMENINAGLSWESRIFFGQKRLIGGAKSPVQFETGLGIVYNVFRFKNGMTIDKDPLMYGATNIIPVAGFTSISRSNWTINTIEIPALLHVDFGTQGTFGNSFNLGFGVSGLFRNKSKTTQDGYDLDGDSVKRTNTNGFHTRLLNYALVGQLGYKNLKITGKLEQLPYFKDNYFPEEAYLGSITVGFSLN